MSHQNSPSARRSLVRQLGVAWVVFRGMRAISKADAMNRLALSRLGSLGLVRVTNARFILFVCSLVVVTP